MLYFKENEFRQCAVASSEKVQINADVIFGWFLMRDSIHHQKSLAEHAVRLKKKISLNKGKQRQIPYQSLASKLDYNRFAVPDVILHTME